MIFSKEKIVIAYTTEKCKSCNLERKEKKIQRRGLSIFRILKV
jgi:hypothetical protein